MKRFIKTYVKKKLTDLLGLALGICEGARSLGKFVASMYECKSERND